MQVNLRLTMAKQSLHNDGKTGFLEEVTPWQELW
jgi:hypothetical protein